jgi:DAK2 domain fusion protein YloV
VLEALDAAAVRRWCSAALDGLTAHQQEIDELNIFPVPDGDTGTNLVLTMSAASEALRAELPTDAAAALAALARGAVLGARGNSGVIVSQLLRGIATELAAAGGPGAAGDPAGGAGRVPGGGPAAGPGGNLSGAAAAGAGLARRPAGRVLAAALDRAAGLAYEAVADPVEGTILSVARAAADGARAADSDDLGTVVRAARAAADEALAQTPRQLPALARAGVVDAGGRGLVVLLDALTAVVTGDLPPSPDPRPPAAAPRAGRALEAARETGSAEFDYEVQYVLAAGADAVRTLRAALAELGDSLVVVGTGDGLWNVHVHVNDVGAAIEAGVQAGRPRKITVTRFADQLAANAAGAAGGPAAAARTGVAVVAVAPGEGVAGLFEAEGVVVVDGGPTRNPSMAEVLAAINGTGAAAVVVLPNSGTVTGVAEAAAAQARAAGIEVAVVPTRSPVQGLAAVAVHDPSRWFGSDVIAMAEAAAATRWAEVTVAVRDALTMAGPCRAGDVLGLADGDVVLIGASVPAVARELIDRMLLLGGELMTVVLGMDADRGLGELLERHVAATHPEVEVSVYDGRQPHYPLLLGVE